MTGEFISMEEESLTINIEVKVEVGDHKEATVTLPPEIRPTARLVQFLNDALSARDLNLKHWTITVPEQAKELENLPNVTMGKEE